MPLDELTLDEVVEGEHEPDDPGHDVVRYDEIRCPECDRRLYCHYWDSAGYPHVICEVGHFEDSWPFEDVPEFKDAYEHGVTP